MLEWGEKTCLNVPLLFEGTPVGELILIESDRERHFSSDETELARALGEQAAIAIVNARFYRRQEEQNRRLMALLETSRSLAASLDVRHRPARHVRRHLGALRRRRTTRSRDAARGGRRRGRGRRTSCAAPAALDRAPGAGDDRRTASRLVAPLVAGDDVEGCVELRVADRDRVRRRGRRDGADPRRAGDRGARQRAPLPHRPGAGDHRRSDRALQPPLLLRTPGAGVRARAALWSARCRC